MREGTEARRHGGARKRRGFTLAELMVAVAVLIVIVLVVGKIFGTVSTLTSIGSGTADVLQEAAAIERQLRLDFERLSSEGVLAIQSNAVRNDVNGARFLNPNLPPNALVRADQLVIFTQGIQTTQTYSPGYGTAQKAQSTTGRVYYGHAFQLPPPLTQPYGYHGESKAHDADPPDPFDSIWPWYEGTAGMAATTVTGPTPSWNQTGLSAVDATQPEARKWLLARQPVLLVDDGGGPNNVFINHISAPSIFWADPAVRSGRVDVAGTTINDVRTTLSSFGALPWRGGGGDQRSNIAAQLVYFPRAERIAPGPHRVDQSLTNHVISSACSSFIVEWTYGRLGLEFDETNTLVDTGVGRVMTGDGSLRVFPGGGSGFVHRGVQVDPALAQPWFGLADADRGVLPYRDWVEVTPRTWEGASTVDPEDIDEQFTAGSGWTQYRAYFGFNHDRAVDRAGNPLGPFDAYTPWPTAVRITMVLHDSNTALENGRTVQFVIELPRRSG